jgi:hypothetical protein
MPASPSAAGSATAQQSSPSTLTPRVMPFTLTTLCVSVMILSLLIKTRTLFMNACLVMRSKYMRLSQPQLKPPSLELNSTGLVSLLALADGALGAYALQSISFSDAAT